MILFYCASELGLPEDLSAIEVILYYYYYYYRPNTILYSTTVKAEQIVLENANFRDSLSLLSLYSLPLSLSLLSLSSTLLLSLSLSLLSHLSSLLSPLSLSSLISLSSLSLSLSPLSLHLSSLSLSLSHLSLSLSISLCSDGSRLSCCDVDHCAPQIPSSLPFLVASPMFALAHSSIVSLPGYCWSPSASLPPCSDPLDDGLQRHGYKNTEINIIILINSGTIEQSAICSFPSIIAPRIIIEKQNVCFLLRARECT